MGVKRRRCPVCRKRRSHFTGKHARGRRRERRWVDDPTHGRICFVCSLALVRDRLREVGMI